jgi:hypothetical protein
LHLLLIQPDVDIISLQGSAADNTPSSTYGESEFAELQDEESDVDPDSDDASDEQTTETETCCESQTHMSTDDMWSELRNLYDAIMSHDISADDVCDNDHLQDLCKQVSNLKENVEKSRTGKLWSLFMEFVAIVRLFIRAERTGNWLLHLKATQLMLPFFAAAGHNNYTKCCRLYFQDYDGLCICLDGPMHEGHFAVRRNAKLYWSGTWSDMTIEQSLMRAGKTQGGLINITHKESARTKWLLTAHIIAQYTHALRSLTDTFTGTWSEQHRDVHPANMRRDVEDMKKFTLFLREHNPFAVEDDQLRNIATGLIADHRVTADDAIDIGRRIHEKLNEKRFGDITLKKADQAVTFAVMRKVVKVGNEDVHMSSQELYHRLMSTASVSGPPDKAIFEYELATVCPALFHDDGTMRKSQKSQLAKYIIEMNTSMLQQETTEPAARVFDGCALLHRIPWPKVGTMETVCSSFVASVVHYQRLDAPVCVIFDNYQTETTKDQEQKRRWLNQVGAPDVAVQDNTPVPGNKTGFLSNKRNKQNTINLLAKHLSDAGVEVVHAVDEGDADVVIVRRALELAGTERTTIVVADDTDILILLLYHASTSANIFLQTKQHKLCIKVATEILGKELCMCLPFVHSMSGCDTTSALYGMGKVKHMKMIQSSPTLRQDVLAFGDISRSKADIMVIGEKYIKSLYSAGSRSPGLDNLRYMTAISPKHVPVERMPPTRRAAYFHSLRVHLQASTWLHLKTVLKKEEYGYAVEQGSVTAIITDKSAAPPELLLNIRCQCKSSTRLCSSCSCSKKGIPCSIHCKCEGHCLNSSKFESENA